MNGLWIGFDEIDLILLLVIEVRCTGDMRGNCMN